MKCLYTLSLTGLVSFIFYLMVLVLPNIEVNLPNAMGSKDQPQEISNRMLSLEFLGLKGNDLTKEQALDLNFEEPVGFLVSNVSKDSPAERANIAEKDVILEVDNNFVYNSSYLESQIKRKQAYDNLTLTIVRNYELLNIPITYNEIGFTYEKSSKFIEPSTINFTTYQDLEFSIKFPSTWNISADELQETISFRSQPENSNDSTREYVRVSIYNDTGDNLDSWLEPSTKYRYQINEGPSEIIIDKSPGKGLTYSYFDPYYGDIKGTKLVTVKNSRVYVVSYLAKNETYSKYLPTISEIISSFNINNIKQYSDPGYNLILKYPANIFTLNKPYDYNHIDYSYANKISFSPNKSISYNYRAFQFSVSADRLDDEIKPIDQNDDGVKRIINELNESYVNYYNRHSNITRSIYDQPTYQLEYSYYDPFKGDVNGILFYTKFNDKAFTIKYEDSTDYYKERLPLILDIIDSIEFIKLKRLLDSENGIYIEYPANWKVIDQESDVIRFRLGTSSNLSLGFESPYSNSTTAGLCEEVLYDNIKLSKFDGYIFLNVKCLSDSKLYTITFNGQYDNLNIQWPFVQNLIDNYIVQVDQNPSSNYLPNEFHKGTIAHPFSVRYSKSTWDWKEQISGYAGKSVSFQPKQEPLVNLVIAYWNENNFQLIEDERADRELNQPIYADERSDIVEDNANLNIKGLTGKAILYFHNLDLYDEPYIQRIFYGKNNNDGNVKIIYSGYASDYLKYWPTAKEMIKSITLNDEIKQTDSHGISVGESPSGIFYDENADIIFVINQRSGSVSLINSTNFQLLKSERDEDINIENVSSEPFDLAYNSNSKSLYLIHNRLQQPTGNCTAGAITKIQFNKPDGHISFNNITTSTLVNETREFCPVDIVVSKNNTIFVADPFNNRLHIINQEGKNINHSLGDSQLDVSQNSRGIGLALDETTNKVYIANPNFKGVQIFDIGRGQIEASGISLRANFGTCPIDITMDQELKRLYVVDTNDNCYFDPSANGTLVVINSQTGEVMNNNITIGKSSNNVIIDRETHKIYVTNSLSDSLTVIDPLIFKPHTINVGISPFGVTTNPNEGLVYITSQGSDSVSMVDQKTNRINHLVTFKIKPSGSGIIKCESSSSILIDKLSFVPDNTKCIAEPTKLSSFVFQSWSSDTGEDLKNEDSGSKNPILDLLGLAGANTELPVKTSGSYVANFVESQSLFTQEQLTGLYTLAAGIFSTWLIPSLTRWIYSGRKSRIQNGTFSGYLKEIQNLDKLAVQEKRGQIIESLSKGKLSESQYHNLDEKLSKLDSNRPQQSN